MKTNFFIIMLVGVFICSYAYAANVAIFDYDDRLNKPDTVAKFIEKKLKEADKSIAIKQFSGKEKEKIAIDTLKKIEGAGYDLIITVTSDALLLAHHYLKKTSVIFTNANNPLFLGFKTLGPSGNNISGATYYVSIKKQIALFKQIQPDINKLGFIFDRDNKSRKVEIGETRKVCQQMGIDYAIELISSKEELPEKAKSLVKKEVDAIVVTTSGKVYKNVGMFIAVCDKAGIPVFSYHKTGVKNGAVAALASDYYVMAEKLVVPMALKVLKKKVSPGAMPIALLDETFIFLNLKQAEKVGLKIPDEIKGKATKIYK